MSQRESAYKEIRNLIAYGKMNPGEKIVENEICKNFGLGRTCVREALSQLQIEGYLEFVANKGFTVALMSAEKVKEIYDTIAVLEGYATRMATKNLNEIDLKKLRQIHAQLKKVADLSDQTNWVNKNRVFHEYLVKSSKNMFLIKLIESLRNRIYRYRLIAVAIPDSLGVHFNEHQKIMEALFEKDANKAGKMMENHIFSVAEKTVNFMKNFLVL